MDEKKDLEKEMDSILEMGFDLPESVEERKNLGWGFLAATFLIITG